MPQHVHMNRKRQPSGLASTLNHSADAEAAKGLPALIHKDVGALGLLLPL